LVALTIAVACGDVIMLPVWVGVASLIVQTHVAYVYAVAVLVVVVAVALVLQLRRARGDARWSSMAHRVVHARCFLWTLVVLVLAWIQPIWEQLFGKGEGNLERLATHAGEGDLTVGTETAVKIVSAVVALPRGGLGAGSGTRFATRR
jgi:heme/copper-type cytochrome/quinol oxidase subunit 2